MAWRMCSWQRAMGKVAGEGTKRKTASGKWQWQVAKEAGVADIAKSSSEWQVRCAAEGSKWQ